MSTGPSDYRRRDVSQLAKFAVDIARRTRIQSHGAMLQPDTSGESMIFAILTEKLLSVVEIVLVISVYLLSRACWHVAVGSFIVGIDAEWVLSSMQLTRIFNPVIFLIGVVVAGVWASPAYFLKRRWASKRAK